MSAYEMVPVDHHGAELALPRELLSELREAAERGQPSGQRLDFPINTISGYGGRLPLQGLGTQPSSEKLLTEVKGWSAIAGAAIARRLRSLSLEVVTDIESASGELETQILRDHPLSMVFAKPNAVFSIGDMLWLAAFHLCQTGEAYWQKVTDGIGVTRELYPLPPQNISLIASETDILAGYLVRDGRGREYALGTDEVIRFWNPEPLTMFASIGALGPQSVEWDVSRYLEEHLRSHFQNDATPRIAIVGKEGATTPDPDQKQDFLAKWKSSYNNRRGSRVGAPAFIPPGFDVKELSAHGGTSELVPLSDQRRDQLLAAYGVPGSIVGMVQDVNRAAAETNHYVFDKNTIEPITCSIAEKLTSGLAVDYDPRLRVRFEDFVSPDKDFKLAQEKQDLDEGVRTVNEIRKSRGADPVEWGDHPIMPFGQQPYTGEAIFDTGSGSEDANDLREPRAIPRAASRAHGDPTDAAQAWRRQVQREKRYLGPFTRVFRKILERQRKHVVKRLRDIPEHELRSKRDRYDDLARQLFAGEDWDAVYRREVQPMLTKTYEEIARDAYGAFLEAETFQFGQSASQAVGRQILRLRQVDAATIRGVTQVLRVGIAEGDSIGGLAKKISESGGFSRKRARTIARTEVATAQTKAQIEGWDASGQVATKTWHTARDSDVRDAHRSMEGTEIEMREHFTLGPGEAADGPGDLDLSAEMRINCRCFLAPGVRGL